MAISITLGGMTVTAKNQDVANLQAAVNEELKLYATKAELEALKVRVGALEGRVEGLGLFDVALEDRVNARLGALESEPDIVLPPDLTTRVEALEALVQRVPAENPQPIPTEVEILPRPAGLDPESVELVYDKATVYYHDMVLHALRIGESRWRLFAQLNFVVISPVLWTYDEVVEGTPEEVYAHATRRIMELAELKPQHDEVHRRVREMSEGMT